MKNEIKICQGCLHGAQLLDEYYYFCYKKREPMRFNDTCEEFSQG